MSACPHQARWNHREHRLYQADWLMRFYKSDVSEIIDEENPYLDPQLDPKANWAVNHLEHFPVEVNTAPLEMLLRVPGIDCARGARPIVRPAHMLPARTRAAQTRYRLQARTLLHHLQRQIRGNRHAIRPRGPKCARSSPRRLTAESTDDVRRSNARGS